MSLGLIGRKLGITQIFSESGEVIPVTVIEAGPCVVVQKKTREKDGYSALQVGFLEKKEKKMNKPLKGHFAKHGTKGFIVLKVARPNQDMRFDIPLVGLETIEAIVKNGGTALAIQSEKTLLIDREEIVSLADAKGLSIIVI